MFKVSKQWGNNRQKKDILYSKCEKKLWVKELRVLYFPKTSTADVEVLVSTIEIPKE